MDKLDCRTLPQVNGAVRLRKPFPSLQQLAAIIAATQICKGKIGVECSSLARKPPYDISCENLQQSIIPLTKESINCLNLPEPCHRILIHVLKWTLIEMNRWIMRIRMMTEEICILKTSIFIKNIEWTSEGRVNEVSSARNLSADTRIEKSFRSKIWVFYGLGDKRDFFTVGNIVQGIMNEIFINGQTYLQFREEFNGCYDLFFNLPHRDLNINYCIKCLWRNLRSVEQVEVSYIRMQSTQNGTDLVCLLFSQMDRSQQIGAVKLLGDFIALSLFCDPVWRWNFLPFLKHFSSHMRSPKFYSSLLRVLVTQSKNAIDPFKCKEIFLSVLNSSSDFFEDKQNHFDLCIFLGDFLEWVLLPLLENGNIDMYEQALKYLLASFKSDKSKRSFLLKKHCIFVPVFFRIDNFKNSVKLIRDVCENFIDRIALKTKIVKSGYFAHKLLLYLNLEDYDKVDQILDYLFDSDQPKIVLFKSKIIRKKYYESCMRSSMVSEPNILFRNLISKDEKCGSLQRFFEWTYETTDLKSMKSQIFDEERMVAIFNQTQWILHTPTLQHLMKIKSSCIYDLCNWLEDAFDEEKLTYYKAICESYKPLLSLRQ